MQGLLAWFTRIRRWLLGGERRRRAFTFARRVLEKFGQDNGYLLSAALSFYAAFAIFPLLLGLVALLAQIFTPAQAKHLVDLYLGSLLGGQARFVSATVAGIRQARGTIGMVSALLLVWSARGIFSNLLKTLDIVHGFGGPTGLKGQIAANAKALAFALGCGAGILVLTGLYWGIEYLLSMGASWIGHSGPLPAWLGVLQHGAPILGFFVGLALLYRFLPSGAVGWAEAAVSAAIGVVLWYPMSLALSFYLTQIARLNAVYGPLSGLMALYIWLNYTSTIVILAAEIGAVSQRS